jgi:hypothetical protein
MAYTYEQLHKMTVAQLRELAGTVQSEDLKGVATMHKEKLLPVLCKALGIEAHVHHHAVGREKGSIKAEIRKLKKERELALSAKDSAKLKEVRRHIHDLKRKLRSMIVAD